MTGATCDTCRYWERHPNPDHEGSGFCHRYPPQLSDYALRFYAENPDPDRPPDDCRETTMIHAALGPDVWFYPVTGEDSVCGEYRPGGGEFPPPGSR